MELLTRKEVATYFKVDPRTVERWLKSGQLKGYKLGKAKTSPWRINAIAMQDFLITNEVKEHGQ